MYYLGESLIGVYLEYLLNNIKNIVLVCRNIPFILLIQIIKIHLHFYKPSLNGKIQSCANYNVQLSEEAKLCLPPPGPGGDILLLVPSSSSASSSV